MRREACIIACLLLGGCGGGGGHSGGGVFFAPSPSPSASPSPSPTPTPSPAPSPTPSPSPSSPPPSPSPSPTPTPSPVPTPSPTPSPSPFPGPLPSPAVLADVLTWHNDPQGTGQNRLETVLTPAIVSSGYFQKLFALPVDGQLYAQPLSKSQVTIGGQAHDVVYVATMHDSVYAFDADAAGPPLWHTSFLGPGVTTVPVTDYANYHDIAGEIGILSTPVIDAATSTLYVVAKTKELAVSAHNGHVYRLHALDLATGAEKLGGPVVLSGSVAGTGDGSVSGSIDFDPYLGNQRPALLLANGNVYVGFGSYGDLGAYHGWLLAYDAATLAQVAILNTTPNNPSGSPGLAGLWMSGASPAFDGASIFLSTGNGHFGAAVQDFADSVLRLGSTLAVLDSFTPSNQASLNVTDFDLDAGGTLILPDQPGPNAHLLLCAGKNGTVFLLDRDALGGFNATDQVIQEKTAVFPGFASSPAYWNGTIYYKGSATGSGSLAKTPLEAFPLVPGSGSTPTQVSFTASSRSSNSWGWPGSTPSISANGTTDGVVWVIEQRTGSSPAAILRAYDATNLATELYDSARLSIDGLGPPVKFTVPTVVNGKVYVGANALHPTTANPGELSVFGLR